MKNITSGLVQLVAIIFITATLAVSTAALSLWAEADTTNAQPSVELNIVAR